MRTIVLALFLSLSYGCGINLFQPTGDVEDDLSAFAGRLAVFSEEDRKLALKDAEEHNDLISIPCWKAVEPYIGKLNKLQADPDGAGIMYRYQRQRDIANLIDGGIPVDLRLGCSPMISQTRAKIDKALLKGATKGIPLP